MTKEDNIFGRRLRYLRERRGISRKVLGELCGLSKNAISHYERGKRIPKADSLCKIADYFEVSTDWMLGRK